MAMQTTLTRVMMYKLVKTMNIEIAHFLPEVSEDHKCSNMHGHSQVVTITAEQSDKDFDGNWVIDLELPEVKFYDHKCLNDFLLNPTIENFSKFLFDKLTDKYGSVIKKVEIQETGNNTGSYERSGIYE